MDPQACIDAARDALYREEWDAAEEHLRAYAEWRDRGGFPARRVRLLPGTWDYMGCAVWADCDASAQGNVDVTDPTCFADHGGDWIRMVLEYSRHWSACLPLLGDSGDDEQFGHDLWLTRQGHGAGFWDGDWREPEATALTEYARSIGDIVIEYDRGFVWGGYAT